VPGFRKGKTPRNVLESLIGKDALLQEALEDMVPEVYEKAIKEKQIEPIARPKVDIKQTNPAIFEAIIPVKPEVNLGNYKDIRIEFNQPVIEEKEISAVEQQVQYQQSTLVPVDRPAEYGDVVTIDVEGEEDGKPVQPRKDLMYELVKDYQMPVPGFVDQIVGVNKNEEKSFTLTYPEDYDIKDLAGKQISFKVKASEIKKREMPELNDDLAKAVGNENLAEMKEKIKAQLMARADQRNDAEYEQKIIEKIIEDSKIEFPPVMAESEIDSMIDEESRNFKDGLTGLENYLKNFSKNMEEHRNELTEVAKKRVLRTLIIDRVAEQEKITVEKAEIDKEIDDFVKQSEKDQENMRKFWDLPQARKSIEEVLTRKKTMDYLKDNAKGKIETKQTQE
jgi:trigger factor